MQEKLRMFLLLLATNTVGILACGEPSAHEPAFAERIARIDEFVSAGASFIDLRSLSLESFGLPTLLREEVGTAPHAQR